MPGLTLAFALAMVVPFAAVAARFARELEGARERRVASGLLFGILLAASFLLFFTGVFPIIGLYLGIWVSSLLAFGSPSGFTKRSVLIANMIALCLTLACSLLLFGYLSVLEVMGSNTDIFESNAGNLPTVQALMAVSLLGASLLVLALTRGFGGAFPATKRGDHALAQFHVFVVFGIVYELLDLVPLSLNTWFAFMPYFLFGGSLLLALFFVVFSFSTAYLGAEAFREAENITLERRKRDGELRMRLYQKEATVDPLTSLSVRRVGHVHLEQLASDGVPYVVAFIDLNNLKDINDTFGHATGDACLQEFARALSTTFPQDEVVRWGGDEFLVITKSDRADLEARLEALHATAHTPAGNIPLQFCFGTGCSEEGSADTVLRRADDAMYASKRTFHHTACEGGAE